MSTIQRVLYELIGVDRASGAFEKAGLSADRMEKRISGLGKSIAIAGAAIAGGAAVIGVESLKAATEFQSSMEKIHTQAGASQKSVESLSKSVLNLGTKTQQGPQELADSLYHLKSVGLGNAAAMKALRAASDLAAVGGASLEDTTNAIAGAWRSGIKGAQSFGQAAATVNAIIGAGNMRMTDFIDAIGTGILPSARTFGVSLKSVGAALALMTDEGIPANSAATRLRMSLSLLGAPSAAAAKQLATIGLTGLQLANAMRSPGGLVSAIALLKSHLDASGLSASKQAILLSHAFGGGRSSSAILTLVNNLSVLERKQAQINDTTNRYGGDVAAQRKTAQAQFALLRSAIDVIGVRIGSALLPPVTKFTGFLARTVVPGAVSAAGTVGRVFTSIIPVKAIEDDWRRLMQFLGVNKPKVPKIIPFTGTGTTARLAPPANVTTNMGGFPARTAAGVSTGLGAALQRVDWAKALGGTPARVVGALMGALGKINWGSFAPQMVEASAGFIIQFANALLDPTVWWHVLQKNWLAIIGLLATAITIPFGGEGGTLFKGLADLIEHIPILKIFAPLLRGVDSLLAPLSRAWRGVLSKAFGWAGKWLRGIGSDAVGKLLLGLEGRFPVIGRWATGALALLEGIFKRAPKTFLVAGILIIRGLWNGMKSAYLTLSGWLARMEARLGGFFVNAGRWLLTAGGHIIEGLLGGIRAKMAGIGSWIKGNIVDPVINAVKSFFGIKSPSTVFHGIGLNLVAGLLRGLATTDGESIAKTIFGSLPRALGSIVSKGLVAIASLPGRALKALGGLGSGILSLLGIGDGGGGAGVKQWSGTVLKVLGMLGQPASALPVVLSQMMTESGGNPRAINLTDSNARAGDPSRGLMQVIGTTFAAYAGPFRGLGIYNPLANIYAGLNYAIHRYGRTGWMSVLGHGHGYARGTAGARRGWAWVGERGPELVRFSGGEHVLDAVTSMKVAAGHLAGYAKGTSLAKIGRELLRKPHKGVLDHEVASTSKRYSSEHLLATAPGIGPARRKHYAAMAAADHKRLMSLNHTLAAERAYRAQLTSRVKVLQATEAAARKEHLPGEVASLARRIRADREIIRHINLWTAGRASFAKAPKPAAKTTAAAAVPTGNLDIADWAAYLDALHGGAPGLAAYRTGSWFVPATAPAVVHRGEMILPADVAQAVRDAASGSSSDGGQFTGNLYLDSGELLGVIDGRIERSDRKFNRRVSAGTGRR